MEVRNCIDRYCIFYTCAAVNPLPEAICAKNVMIAEITGTAGVREMLRLWKYAVLWSQRSSFLRMSTKIIKSSTFYTNIYFFLIKK